MNVYHLLAGCVGAFNQIENTKGLKPIPWATEPPLNREHSTYELVELIENHIKDHHFGKADPDVDMRPKTLFGLLRRTLIEEILGKGNIAVFTSNSGVIKKANEWKETKEGDLICFSSTGVNKFVAWDVPHYTLTSEPGPSQ